MAHAIAGMRVFPGTLTFADPGVTDELDLNYANAALADAPGDAAPYASTYSLGYSKTITPDLGLSIGTAYQSTAAPGAPAGLQNLNLGIDYQLFESDRQETLVTGALNESLGNTGSAGVGTTYSVFSPTLLFGRGFGDLPSSLRDLRPLAISGIIAPNIPSTSSVARSLTWGLSVQYSLPYLQTYVRDIGLRAPLNNIVPLVEFPMQTFTSGPYAGQTIGTINPGFVWIGHYGQVGIEATLPVNNASGHGLGVVLGAGFYFDDIYPHGLGAPLFPNAPKVF
ncbi:MAG TPA: hypothetical protein VMV40_10145 [Acidiferrobacter sp.]|nr:hypothetical protein [Acidiferrobacter sp.]